jgi:hypothetical protein
MPAARAATSTPVRAHPSMTQKCDRSAHVLARDRDALHTGPEAPRSNAAFARAHAVAGSTAVLAGIAATFAVSAAIVLDAGT